MTQPRGDVSRLLRHPAVVPVALVVFTVGGGLLRLSVAHQDLFADELATYWVVTTRSLGGVVRTVTTTAEITPPFSFMLSWFTAKVGHSPVMIRLPALVAGIASIPLVYAVGVRTVGRGAALVATALTTLSPFMIYYSAEARGYGVLMALLLLSTWCLLQGVDSDRRGWWVGYGFFVLLAVYTHYTALFVLAAQFGWVFWVHRGKRWPLVVSTGVAVVAYLPWLPSLRGDLDSGTTEILSNLLTMTPEWVRLTLSHWSIGFPYPGARSGVGVVPGVPALCLLAAGIAVGAGGMFTMRSRLGPWFAAREKRIVLVVLLALATPVGTLAQSAVGTNVFSARPLAASWPYLALTVAALITVGRPAVRYTSSLLVVGAFALGAWNMQGTNLQRPHFSRLATFTEAYPDAVVVDGFAFTPGPLSNLDVEGVAAIRLNVPEQRVKPFGLMMKRPYPAEVVARAVAETDGRPIILISGDPPLPVATRFQELLLGTGYVLTHTERTRGLLDLQAFVYERSPATG